MKLNMYKMTLAHKIEMWISTKIPRQNSNNNEKYSLKMNTQNTSNKIMNKNNNTKQIEMN